ncbi:MAG: DoxX family protein [Bacteroidota bacterium]|nr:DoxX family protein [Bacteroidota bacterium]
MKRFYQNWVSSLERAEPLALLSIRILLAYGFYKPAMNKIRYFQNIVDWFSELGIPFPTVNAVLSTTTESLGVILLALGLFTRIVAFPLMVVMIVAIVTVHWGNGFDAGNNGMEIPLYYMAMLLILATRGAGKWSLDHFFLKDRR